VSTTPEEVVRAVDEGFLAGLAEPFLRTLVVWNGCPYPDGSSAATHWRAGYDAGYIVRRQGEARHEAIPDP
jgi:hypothetical protein